MPTINPTIEGRKPNDASFPGESSCVTWPALGNGDTGAPIAFGAYTDRTIQFHGTFGVGGAVAFEGSNDNTNWFTLTDPQGNPIAKTSAALEAVSEATRFVRPHVTGGDGSTSITAVLFMRG